MGDMNVVYRLEGYTGKTEVDQGAGYTLVEWRPSLTRIIPSNIAYEKNGFLKNWVFHLPRFLAGGEVYSVFSLVEKGEVLCQCILTPASMRYAFMKPGDMQFGLVYTAPEHRNRKLGNALIAAAMESFGKERTYWWLTELDNFASQKLAGRLGFQLVGKARRESTAGFSYYRLVESIG